MGDIESIEKDMTVSKIYESYEKKQEEHPTRSIGASILGHPCTRYLWYLFRHCTKESFNGRILRLFETGDIEEDRLVADLRRIGCNVIVTDDTDQQFHVSACGGHVSGYLDGCLIGLPEAPKTWHVLECKSHNDKNFKKLVREGVKKGFPKHYCQMMVYMHLTGMERALYIAANKNDDTLYKERINYNKEEAEAMLDRAKNIVTSMNAPMRIAEKPDYYVCKHMCSATQLCFGPETPIAVLPIPFKSCRQCCHATPLLVGNNGEWLCEKHCRGLSMEDQLKACDDHLILPGLLATYEPIDSGIDQNGNEYIQFSNEDLGKWTHGQASGMFKTEELMKLPISLLSNEMLNQAKETFNAEAGNPDDLLGDYLNSVEIWSGPLSKSAIETAWKEKYGDELSDCIPLRKLNTVTYSIAEYVGGRIITADIPERKAEIREKKQENK